MSYISILFFDDSVVGEMVVVFVYLRSLANSDENDRDNNR